MAQITGARGTGNVTQGLRRIDMADDILLLQPSDIPLTVFSKRMSKAPTHNPAFQWTEDDLEARFDAVNNGAGYNTSATSIVVDDGTKFEAHDLVKNPRTGEVFRVTSISTNTLTVVRGVGNGGTGVAMNDNDELIIMGSAQPEGDTSKAARSGTNTIATNYTQIFREPVESTETWIHSDQYVRGNDWDYQLRKKGIEHAKDIEYAFLLGKPSEDTSGSQPRRTTGGALNYITTNVTAAGGTLSETSFFAALRSAFRYGSGTKLALTSGLAVDVLNAYARSKISVQMQERTTYGVNITKFQSPHGTLNIARHWLLEGSVYGGYMLVIDMEAVKYRYLADEKGSRDTHIREDIQTPDADTRKAEYLTEAGLQMGEDKKHALITGITG